MTKRLEEYMSMLADEGFRPSLDDDGDIGFKHEGTQFFLNIPEDDATFMRVILMYNASGDPDTLFAAANSVNVKIKAVKANVFPEYPGVWFTLEAFYSAAEDFKPHFGRSISILKHAADMFFQEVSELSSSSKVA